MRKKIKIHTFGCRTNQYESQSYVMQLNQLGYDEVAENPNVLHFVTEYLMENTSYRFIGK